MLHPLLHLFAKLGWSASGLIAKDTDDPHKQNKAKLATTTLRRLHEFVATAI